MDSSHSLHSSIGLPEHKALSYQEVYPCPVCRHGQISELLLMDAFACNFCRHIFTANLREQTIRLEDSAQVFQWRWWRGRTWKPARRQQDFDLTLIVWLTSMALATLPPALIWLPYHTFPPLPDSRWYWFPALWTVLTFLVHLALVLWLLVEHYQFPAYIALRIQLQRWRGQL